MTAKILMFTNGQFHYNGLTVQPKTAIRYQQYADSTARKVLDRILVKKYFAPNPLLPAFLDPHQKEGVRWILSRSRSYLAHAPGAGKTAQAIVAALLTEERRPETLFIVPPSLTLNWEREIVKFSGWGAAEALWPSISIIPDSSKQEYAGWKSDFIICPDSMLTKPWVLRRLIAMKKKFVAVDEASRFKESDAERTRALFGGLVGVNNFHSPGLIQDARHAVLLDGSPMPNRPMELWAPTIAMAPQTIDFMPQEDFGFRYCGATINSYGRWEFKHSSREEELRERLQKDFMHVVKEEQLDHPERLRSILLMNTKLSKDKEIEWGMKFSKSLNLKDIDENSASQDELASIRKEIGLAKVDWTVNYISERLRTKNESILIFAWHREVAETSSAQTSEIWHAISHWRNSGKLP